MTSWTDFTPTTTPLRRSLQHILFFHADAIRSFVPTQAFDLNYSEHKYSFILGISDILRHLFYTDTITEAQRW